MSNHQEVVLYRDRDIALVSLALHKGKNDYELPPKVQDEMAELLHRFFPDHEKAHRDADNLREALENGMPITAEGPTRESVTAFLVGLHKSKEAAKQPVQKVRAFSLGDEDLPF